MLVIPTENDVAIAEPSRSTRMTRGVPLDRCGQPVYF